MNLDLAGSDATSRIRNDLIRIRIQAKMVREKNQNTSTFLLSRKYSGMLLLSRAVDPDPHSFSLLDPDLDPGWKILRKKRQGN